MGQQHRVKEEGKGLVRGPHLTAMIGEEGFAETTTTPTEVALEFRLVFQLLQRRSGRALRGSRGALNVLHGDVGGAAGSSMNRWQCR